MIAFRNALVEETRRRLIGESIPRLRHCLDILSDEEIWRRPSPKSNSVGNLVLHLCGNARQWIGAGLGQLPDIRNRQAEFDENGPVPREELLQLIRETEEMMEKVLENVQAEDLLRMHAVQTFEESGLSILVHVVEHFSYHVGQVSYFTKALKDADLGYYRDVKLQ
ncbi:MAG: DUF1572 family protein [Lewinellaceae bacterium]|nr:DUF1572 family protein [Lewinellaceae bacterium]